MGSGESSTTDLEVLIPVRFVWFARAIIPCCGIQVGNIEQENAPAARANKGKETETAGSSRNGPRVCADCGRTMTSLVRSGRFSQAPLSHN